MVKKKTHKKDKVKDYVIKISQMQSNVKTFVKKFKSDVDKKRKSYQLCAQKLREKK